MNTIPVKNMKGEDAGEYALPGGVLEFEKGEHAVYEAVVAHLAAKRSGTASTKGKGAVAGSGDKPWRQKGTGRARAGYSQSPVWRGGAVAFGPHPRDYRKPLNKKTARLAFRRAFSDKTASGQVLVLESFVLDKPRTRLVYECLKRLNATAGALLVMDSLDDSVVKAARNIPDLEITTARELNTYVLLRAPVVIVVRAAMQDLERRLKPIDRRRTAG